MARSRPQCEKVRLLFARNRRLRDDLRCAELFCRVNYRYVQPSAPPADVQCFVEQPIFLVNLLSQTSFV
jgi:hypothetical protein